MRALVTGGAGFIGSTLVDRLLRAGHSVVAVDDLRHGRRANLTAALAAGATLREVDVAGPELADVLAEVRPEVVFHLAAQIDVRVSVADPLLDVTQNVVATINLAEAARLAGTRKIVFASSGGSIYGTPDQLPVTESAPVNPKSPYAASKVSAEVYLNTYRELHALIAKEVGVPDEPDEAPARLGDLRASALDTTAAQADLGWTPQVDIVEGIRRTVDHFRAR